MRKMAHAKILISGMTGLGVEVAKNVILSGVQERTKYYETFFAITDRSDRH